MLLTLALGIGANSAIFTLVNAILLDNLPATDPKTLIRIGDEDNCCVNSGWNDKGDYSLFATDTYYMYERACRSSKSGPRWNRVTPGGPLPSPRRTADGSQVCHGNFRFR